MQSARAKTMYCKQHIQPRARTHIPLHDAQDLCGRQCPSFQHIATKWHLARQSPLAAPKQVTTSLSEFYDKGMYFAPLIF